MAFGDNDNPQLNGDNPGKVAHPKKILSGKEYETLLEKNPPEDKNKSTQQTKTDTPVANPADKEELKDFRVIKVGKFRYVTPLDTKTHNPTLYLDNKEIVTTQKGEEKVTVEKATIYFGSDKFDADENSKAKVTEFAQKLIPELKKGEVFLTIEGHTDTQGSDDYNKALSAKRASTINMLLKAGVPIDLLDNLKLNPIIDQAQGEKKLAVQTKDGVEQDENRRVELSFEVKTVSNDVVNKEVEYGYRVVPTHGKTFVIKADADGAATAILTGNLQSDKENDKETGFTVQLDLDKTPTKLVMPSGPDQTNGITIPENVPNPPDTTVVVSNLDNMHITVNTEANISDINYKIEPYAKDRIVKVFINDEAYANVIVKSDMPLTEERLNIAYLKEDGTPQNINHLHVAEEKKLAEQKEADKARFSQSVNIDTPKGLEALNELVQNVKNWQDDKTKAEEAKEVKLTNRNNQQTTYTGIGPVDF